MENPNEKDPGWQYLRLSRDAMAKETSKPYDSKKNFWVPDAEEGYLWGELVSTKGDVVTITAAGNEKKLKKDLLQEMNPSKFEKTEDMSNLSMLNDACVLYNLRSRYSSMLIYTYSGLFCIVINPYKRLPIYTDSVARMYMGKRRNEMPPHLFSVSDEAYRNMLQNKENQSMLITGESGAGKTENTKKVICYFAAVGASQQEGNASGGEGDKKKMTLEDQIVQTNPVLEAFGNAKTVRNNNSSRFGKFIRIHFNRQGRLASCDIEHYLLEKSRVIRQAPGERCYHIFYQIFSDFKPSLKKELLLDLPLKDYWFVAQAELAIDGLDDAEEMALTDEAFDILLFTQREKLECFKLMSAIMHMGNMKFKQRPREEQAEADGEEEAKKAAKMYGLNSDVFLNALLKPRVKVGTEWVSKGQNVDQVAWGIGAMSKGLYARVFHWLVNKCNLTLESKGLARDFFIGVLDIAGFEIFDFNSFEQLWINFVNEKLQQFFNHHMFVLEQEEYAREGIEWVFIDFGLDLAACIELIEKPMGIISMLDEECIVPKATDMTLAAKLSEVHLGKHPNFEKPRPPKGKQAEAHFAMKHYAGTVRYNVSNWLEKNKDPLNDTVVSCMKASNENELLVEIWQSYVTQEEASVAAKTGGGAGKKGKSGSFMTVSMLYRESLNKLMDMLHKTHPHFIRCIIPNEKKLSGYIDATLVLNQLTCNGVLEGIRICKKGFPNRLQHPDFTERYAILGPNESRSTDDPKKNATAMLERLVKEKKLTDEHFRVGHTKVFFKAGIVASIEEMREDRIAEIITAIQGLHRYNQQKIEVRMRRAQLRNYTILQKNIRNWSILRTWDWFLLYGLLKPHLKSGKYEEEMAKLNAEVSKLEGESKKAAEVRAVHQKQLNTIKEERDKYQADLTLFRDSGDKIQDTLKALNDQKLALERNASDAKDKLADNEAKREELERFVKKGNKDREQFQHQIECLEENLKKSEQDKEEKAERIRQLQDEMINQDESIAKLNKDKKRNEEENRKLGENLQAEEEKHAQAMRLKIKLEKAIEEIEDNLDRERRIRSDIEKSKKKIENELGSAQENLEELGKRKADLEAKLAKVDEEVHSFNVALEEKQRLCQKIQRQIKDQTSRIAELEEELETERQARAKVDKSKGTVQLLLDEINDALDEEAGKIAAQNEISKKKDLEVMKLRQELEEANINNDTQFAALRKRNSENVMELTEKLEHMQKSKAKSDKDKDSLRRQVDDVAIQLGEETKSKLDQERIAKNIENQVSELQVKTEQQYKTIQELLGFKSRVTGENGDLESQVEEMEVQLTTISKKKAQVLSQLEDAKRTMDEEHREKQELSATTKNLQHEIDVVHEQIEDEIVQKEEILKQFSKAKAEIQQWKAKFESEGLTAADEMEEEKRRRAAKIGELQEAIGEANNKCFTYEKLNNRLIVEAEDARVDAERYASQIGQLEKKHGGFDKIIDEWKRQVDDLSMDIEKAQNESRSATADSYALQSTQTTLTEQADELRRENKNLANAIRDLNEQVNSGNRTSQEMGKKVRMFELEKEELQHALDEAEAALEAEESKVIRVQTEVSQIRSEIDRRIQEKEEDFENTLKTHQRALESMQTTLETETKGKNVLLQGKKKLEGDINELELALDHANKTNVDAQKNIKKCIVHVQELQSQLEEEQKIREEYRENYLSSEKKYGIVQGEVEELMLQKMQIEKLKQQLDTEIHDLRTANNELSNENSAVSTLKRNLENDIVLTRDSMEKSLSELKTMEESYKKILADIGRLSEELHQEQQHYEHVDRIRKGFEQSIKELQVKLEEAEINAHRNGQRNIEKLDGLVKKREQELETESRRHKETVKLVSRHEREVRERQFDLDEQKKSAQKMQELIEKLQGKIKVQKRQAEEAEELATINLQKYRQQQIALDHAEERAEEAENSLIRMKTNIRVGVSKSEKKINTLRAE
uniref:Myosin head n=1 Tax=Rhabditophanes sp. KR3021 TaxID=114890 RepID=A0AC35TWR3_9BILA